MNSNNCILLFGGAFNPIHNGHILNVKSVELTLRNHFYENLRVCLSVSNIKHFNNTRMVDISERLNVVKEICLDYENWFAIKELTNYSVDTVKYLKRTFGCDICLLIGTDQANQFDRWYRSTELLDLISELAIFDMESGQYIIGEQKFQTLNFSNVRSTDIRNLIKEEKSDEVKLKVPEPAQNLFRFYI